GELLSPYALLGGATFMLVFLLHGAVFVTLKTGGDVRVDAKRVALRLIGPTVLVAGGFVVWTQLAYGAPWTWALVAVAAISLLAVAATVPAGREGWAFAFTTVGIAATSALLFGSLFPDVMPSTIDAAFSLTVDNASSTP